jgi:uridine kinase
MSAFDILHDSEAFSAVLYERMKGINPGIEELELYEFRYALANLYPGDGGWASVALTDRGAIERLVNSRDFYAGIQIKPTVGGRIVLDGNIVRLAQVLFVGLVTGVYTQEWVLAHFFFDLRGFFFLHRTVYLTDKVREHLGGRPVRAFEQRQKRFERCQSIGYKEFRQANEEIDEFFMAGVKRLVAVKGTPLLCAIAGPTAAGKTEIVERLRQSLGQAGHSVSSIEMDNFLTDREGREQKGIYSLGREAIHLELFRQSLEGISQGKRITMPRYDFYFATSSHDLDGRLKPGCSPIEVDPADVVFIEGNFPFLLPEVAHLIGIKVVYLTDDAIRLKRKWKRDIDYRKKYEPTYFRNRFFKDQFLMAQKCYVPQMEVCDIVVDTTGATVWATPEIAAILDVA